MTRRREKPQLQFDFMIFPEGCRRGSEVPHDECSTCELGTLDHTVGFMFKNKNHELIHGEAAYCHVCLKDYEKVVPGTIAKMRLEEG